MRDTDRPHDRPTLRRIDGTADAPRVAYARQAQRRLAALLAGLAGIALLSILLTWAALALTLRSLESVWHDRVEALEYIHDVDVGLERAIASISGQRDTGPSGKADVVDSARGLSVAAWNRFLGTWLTEEEAGLVRDVTPAVELMHHRADSLAQLYRQGDTVATRRYVDTAFRPALDSVSAGLEPLVRLQARVTREQVMAARTRHRVSRTLLIASAVTMLALVATAFGGAQRTMLRTLRR